MEKLYKFVRSSGMLNRFKWWVFVVGDVLV